MTINEHGETVYTVEEANAMKKWYLKSKRMKWGICMPNKICIKHGKTKIIFAFE